MPAILAIDAAWTPGNPSGVALLDQVAGAWQCVGLAPSYQAFTDLANGGHVDWQIPAFHGAVPNPQAILAAANAMLGPGHQVNLVTVDLPMATVPINGRRRADQAISEEFGERGCSTHTPNAERPGPLGAAVTQEFSDEGFPLATTATHPGHVPSLVEVYPHPALLSLLGVNYRVAYKVDKRRDYWPDDANPIRWAHLIGQYNAILEALQQTIEAIALPLPAAQPLGVFDHLKKYEDALDALVAAWTGIQYLNGNALPYGDATAAIWT